MKHEITADSNELFDVSKMEPCEFLIWDSKFFNRRIARVLAHRLDQDLVLDIQRWCKIHEIECLYFLADSDHVETIRLAEEHEFNFVDIRVSLQCNLKENRLGFRNNQDQTVLVRPSCTEDILTLQAIAKSSYDLSRYYFDPNFSRQLCDTFYETWIKNSCQGYADIVLVAEKDKTPVGYITCHLSKDSCASRIGLVGVDMKVRGCGVGYMLVSHALHWLAEHGINVVNVVTQGRNIQALRLYQKFDFWPDSVRLWYHKWTI